MTWLSEQGPWPRSSSGACALWIWVASGTSSMTKVCVSPGGWQPLQLPDGWFLQVLCALLSAGRQLALQWPLWSQAPCCNSCFTQSGCPCCCRELPLACCKAGVA